ncbi:hypothetical protein VD0002_g10066 [Verticillium dahliae]|uniref:Uncharacterized protein n=1 Tax=Verticillium dahliae TaxID=27337 RepID=A0AA44WEP0_VERDA|nr:hypothetical protein BJF96_g7473 [Verticillium dahliae]PNH53665.1 hypothetical protein VD0002_g10066 [Verticillium dahliae]
MLVAATAIATASSMIAASAPSFNLFAPHCGFLTSIAGPDNQPLAGRQPVKLGGPSQLKGLESEPS